MTGRINRLRSSAGRFGLGKTVLRYGYEFLQRFVRFDICTIYTDTDASHDYEDVPNYETRCVDRQFFDNNLCNELQGRDFGWLFERGDTCTASITDGQVVGYNFTSTQPTRVLDGLCFLVPDGYVYSFASHTTPAHRGRKLEPLRWKTSREHRVATTGQAGRIIYYIAIANLESRAAHARSEAIVLGYSGYARLFGRWYVFRSSGCRQTQSGFSRDSQSAIAP